MSKWGFDDEIYNDDRMFVTGVYKCSVNEDEDCIATIIHHTNPPKEHKWCVAIFRNVSRYRALRAYNFDTEIEAKQALAEIEPTTPLISLGGNGPKSPMSYDEYLKWKTDNNLQDYDYKKMFPADTVNPEDTIYERKT